MLDGHLAEGGEDVLLLSKVHQATKTKSDQDKKQRPERVTLLQTFPMQNLIRDPRINSQNL